jgi:hypothetical protein
VFLDLDLLAGANIVARDVDLVAVHANMPVIDHLTSRGTALCEAEEVDHAVEAGFKELEKPFARDSATALGDFKHTPELAFEKAIGVPELLLFVEADRIL